jgi:hypothetical protein
MPEWSHEAFTGPGRPSGASGATGDQQLDKVSLRLLLRASTQIETRLKTIFASNQTIFLNTGLKGGAGLPSDVVRTPAAAATSPAPRRAGTPRKRQVALDRKRLSSSFVIAITSSGCRSARARIPRVLLDTDDTKPMGKRHRHDTEGM